MKSASTISTNIMSKLQYLYGLDVDTSTWENAPYALILQHKIALATRRIKALNKANHLWRDSYNINKCLRAIKFNNELLGELNGR